MHSEVVGEDGRTKAERDRECQRVSDAIALVRPSVVPMYVPRNKRVPGHGGCGVLVRLNEQIFIFTASHVHRGMNDDTPGEIQAAIEGRFVALQGRAYRTDPVPDAGDPLDVGVIEVADGEGASILRPFALSLDPAAIRMSVPGGRSALLFGYPHKTAERTQGKTVRPGLRWWHGFTILRKTYAGFGLHHEVHVAMNFDLQESYDEEGRPGRSPSPAGVSGTGLWIMIEEDAQPQLVAIFTDARDGLLYGTNIRAHLATIQHRAPEIFSKWVDGHAA